MKLVELDKEELRAATESVYEEYSDYADMVEQIRSSAE